MSIAYISRSTNFNESKSECPSSISVTVINIAVHFRSGRVIFLSSNPAMCPVMSGPRVLPVVIGTLNPFNKMRDNLGDFIPYQ